MEIGIPVPRFSLYSTCVARKHPEQEEQSTTAPTLRAPWEEKGDGEERELEKGKFHKRLDPTCRSLEMSLKAKESRREQQALRQEREDLLFELFELISAALSEERGHTAQGTIRLSQLVRRREKMGETQEVDQGSYFWFGNVINKPYRAIWVLETLHI